MSDIYDIIRQLKNTPELVPEKYDASYELVTEVIKVYSKFKDFSFCDYKDLDLIYLSSVGTWKHSVEKKEETIRNSNLPNEEKEYLLNFISSLWERVNNGDFSHSKWSGKITFGMFGTGFFTTRTKTDDKSVQKFVKMCVDLLPIENDEDAFEIVDKAISNGFKGLAAGGISMVLHCLKPFIFPILNSYQEKGANIFKEIGIDLKKTGSEITYISNSREIKEYRDANFSWKNYRIFELVEIQSTEKEECDMEKYINLLSNNRNLILTGAPGTGKTHLAKEIAKAMGCADKDNFVQFHPSYDYTDFVEGLRPKNDDDGNVGFECKDGVFKKFCKRALKANFSDGIDNFDEAWEKLLEELEDKDELQIQSLSQKANFSIVFNKTGTGLKHKNLDGGYFSKEQLYNVYRGLPGTSKKGLDNYRKAIIAKMKSDFGLKDYKVGTETVEKKNFVFIIDEINRGEISKIFGELFFSIDPGYRGKEGLVQTQYQNLVEEGDDFFGGFFVPENVYIIGTMNDIDRSVESMDFAFRRRFAFCEIMASENVGMLDALGNDNLKDDAINRMERLNQKIEEIEGLSSAYHIGASYFLKLKNYDGNFDGLWQYHIEGLLREYLRGNPEIESEIKKLKSAYENENVATENNGQ